jgi:hypothetical protein
MPGQDDSKRSVKAAAAGARAGDRVLLAVFPARDALAAYWFAVVD